MDKRKKKLTDEEKAAKLSAKQTRTKARKLSKKNHYAQYRAMDSWRVNKLRRIRRHIRRQGVTKLGTWADEAAVLAYDLHGGNIQALEAR